MVTKEDIPAHPDHIRVTFSVPGSIWADCIELAGDFNHWNAASAPLHRAEECWYITLTLERGKMYGFRYLVDHRDWMGDAQADSYTMAPDGCVTSIIVARHPSERLEVRAFNTPAREPAPVAARTIGQRY